MVIQKVGREMPEETRYTKEEVEAYEVALALSASDMHFRFKMKRLAERSLVPEVGRALGNNYHIRVDQFGNPEILYNRSVVVRFTIDGIRLSKENVSVYDKTVQNMFTRIVHMYTDYRFDGYSLTELSPRRATEIAKEEGYDQHSSGYGVRMGDGCSVCQKHEAVLKQIEAEAAELNKKYKARIDSMKVPFKAGSENENEAFPVIPYKDEVEKSLPDFIERAYEDMKTKRGWKRKEK